MRLADLWQKQALPGFEGNAFQRRVIRDAWHDWQHYRAAHDDEAAAANYDFWRDHCPPFERMLLHLKTWLRPRLPL